MLALVRHGATEANENGRLQGLMDIGLSDAGRLQAINLAYWAVRQGVDGIISSHLLRARETAQIVAERVKISPSFHDELCERNYGKYENLDINQLIRVRSEKGHSFSDPTQDWANIVGVESDQEVFARVAALIKEVYPPTTSKNIMVVTHAGVIKSILYIILDISPVRYNCIKIPNGSVVVLNYDQNGHLQLQSLYPQPR